MSTIAVLGANGRLSRTVAKAFLEAGYDVIAVTRSGKPLPELAGARFIAADAMNAEELIRATRGADIIFNGLNPLYTEWEEKVMPMARNVLAACKANGAMHLFSGQCLWLRLADAGGTSRRHADAADRQRKARIRVEMKRMFRQEAERPGGVQTIVLRAGDYFGGTGTGFVFRSGLGFQTGQRRLYGRRSGKPRP